MKAAFPSRAIIGILVAAICCLLISCAKGKAEWHPGREGSGAWYDASAKRIAALRKSAEGDGLFELTRFSLDPAEGRISYLSFAARGEDSFACPDDESLTLAISGPALRFAGKYEDGTAFEERYAAVDRAFLARKSAEAASRGRALEGKKDPSLREQQEAWVLEMIAQTLDGIELPR